MLPKLTWRSGRYVQVFSLENGGDDDDNLGMSSWKQIDLIITGKANSDWLGRSVSLSDNAKTLAVGAPYANDLDSGHVRVYRTDDSKSGWTQIGVDIDGEAAGDTSPCLLREMVRPWLSALMGMMTTGLTLVT